MNGLVLLRNLDDFGVETAFRLIFAGQTCGWRSLFAEQPHTASALVLETSTVCFIPSVDVLRMIDVDASLGKRFLKTVARDSGPVDALLLRSAHLNASLRLVHLILILNKYCSKDETGPAISYRLPIKRKHIASFIGTSRETVSRAIKELEESSLAFFRSRTVSIPDIELLKEKFKLTK